MFNKKIDLSIEFELTEYFEFYNAKSIKDIIHWLVNFSSSHSRMILELSSLKNFHASFHNILSEEQFFKFKTCAQHTDINRNLGNIEQSAKKIKHYFDNPEERDSLFKFSLFGYKIVDIKDNFYRPPPLSASALEIINLDVHKDQYFMSINDVLNRLEKCDDVESYNMCVDDLLKIPSQ